MKRSANIHNLSTLKMEIYRLELEAKRLEDKLDDNLEHLRKNYFSMSMNSIFDRGPSSEGKSGFFDAFFKNESFRSAVNKATDHIASQAAERIEDLVDKIVNKQK
jgi:hypothetical protein